MSELNRLTADVTRAMDGYDPTEAGRRISDFIDELSNWYVRRSRRRFWKSENDADKLMAYHTLYHCLVTLSGLLAPFTPFLAEELYQNLVRSVDALAADSIHLTDFPESDTSKIDERLSTDVGLVMKVCSLGRAARSKAGIKVRQPLEGVLIRVRSSAEQESLERLAPQVMEELNVKKMEVGRLEDVVDFEVKPNLVLLGPKYGRDVETIARELGRMDPAIVVREVEAGRNLVIAGHTIEPREVLVGIHDRKGYTSSGLSGGYLVAVETEISPQLRDEGLAREVVHILQTMRREAGFDIADYIVTYYRGEESIQRVIEEFAGYIKQETLSRQLLQGAPEEGAYTKEHHAGGLEVTLAVKKLN